MSAIDTAISIAEQLLRRPDEPEQSPSPEDIRDIAQRVVEMLRGLPDSPVDLERLVRELESRFSIWIGSSTALDDFRNHIEWLAGRRNDIEWRFWTRYERLLAERKLWAPATISRLDQTTDQVLSRLEDPQREGRWDRRGLVVGQVQAGKTSHYTGLICKAADSGYRVIVVLAGSTNNLRSQTQLRLDEGFLGFDSRITRKFDKSSPRVGVGNFLPREGKPPVAHTGTNSEDNGDFSTRVAQSFGIQPGGADPLLLVVKKNKTVLENLRDWARGFQSVRDPEHGHPIQRGIPLLLIDDEADYASINTRPLFVESNTTETVETEPATINRLIREILNSFEQSAYVGYTATPFANIFIYPGTDHEVYGEDLFPRDFILQLPSPSNYFGAPALFGHQADHNVGIEESIGLPLIRTVDDADPWIPLKHKKQWIPGPLPSSLEDALLMFLIATSVRRARGSNDVHNTMLVHVTRFVNVQAYIAEQLEQEVRRIRNRLRYGESGDGSVMGELRRLWKDDYLPTYEELLRDRPELRGELPPVSWSQVERELEATVARVDVLKVNGSASDALAYWNCPDGLYAIAVGGDKLSRGLTLEGLTISYYLRASRLYDTLMQMGRWFGYRPAYLDVCRIFTTAELQDSYRHLSLVEQELQRDFQEMADARRTPNDFGLKVRSHPGGLTISGAGKLRHGLDMEVSYAGRISESIVFSRHPDDLRFNIERLEKLLSANRDQGRRDKKDNWILTSVRGEEVASFLSGLRTPHGATKAVPAILARYIRAQIPSGELTHWTVVVVSNSAVPSELRYSLVGVVGGIGLTQRKEELEGPEPLRYTIGRLVNPPDEMIDLNAEQRQRALELTQAWHREHPDRSRYQSEPSQPGGPFIRKVREPENGLLLIYLLEETIKDTELPSVGFALSFPESTTAKSVKYKVNEVYQEEFFGDA